MNSFLFYLLQFTWGIPQNLLGFLLFLLVPKKDVRRFHRAVACTWKKKGSLSLGMFLFLSDAVPSKKHLPDQENTILSRLTVHEYGHSIQSIILGPLYLPVIGLPSFLWAELPALRKRRRKSGISYFSLYTERWANALGEKVTGSPSMGQAVID